MSNLLEAVRRQVSAERGQRDENEAARAREIDFTINTMSIVELLQMLDAIDALDHRHGARIGRATSSLPEWEHDRKRHDHGD